MLIGLDLPSVGGGTEAGVPSPQRSPTVLVRGETFKAESETADLGQPKWNENQTILATAIIPRTGTLVPWKAQWLGGGV